MSPDWDKSYLDTLDLYLKWGKGPITLKWQLPCFRVSKTCHMSPNAKLSPSFHVWSSVYHVRGHFFLWVWGNESIGEMLAMQACGSVFRFPEPTWKAKLSDVHLWPQPRMGGQEGLWVSLNSQSRPSELQVRSGEPLRRVTAINLCQMSTCMCMCTPTHIGTHTWACMSPSTHRGTLFHLSAKFC